MITTEDATAIHILKTIARSQCEPGAKELMLNPELGSALAAAFGEIEQTPASEGELARAALALLSEDPTLAARIQSMTSQAADSGRPKRFFDPATIALTTAVLLVLQTHVKFKADNTGKWSIEIDKKSGSDAAIKAVVQKLLSFIGK